MTSFRRPTATQIDRVPAEAIRSACLAPSHATLTVDGAQLGPVLGVYLADDSVYALVTEEGRDACDPDTTAMIEVVDYSPIDLRDPVRSLIWLQGFVSPVPVVIERDVAHRLADENPGPSLLDVGFGAGLLKLELTSAVVVDSVGAAAVTPAELAECLPDPFATREREWLAHLDTDHAGDLIRIANHIPGVPPGRIRPLALDRCGISLRVEGNGDHDVRVAFFEPVATVEQLSRAIRSLAT